MLSIENDQLEKTQMSHNESTSLINGDVPKILKWVMIFIDRVGFPIVAFLIMSFLCFHTIEKNTKALDQLTEAVKSLKK